MPPHLSLQDLHMLLVDDIQRFEGVAMVVLTPQSTFVANAYFASLAVDTGFLAVDSALLLLRASRGDGHFLLHGMKTVQDLR